MRKALILGAWAVVAVTMAAPGAFAFSTVSGDDYPNTALSTKLADPDDIMDDMASEQMNHSNTVVNRFGGGTLEFTGPSGSGTYDSRFLPDPAASTVPSKQTGW
jgi:hypothetical protein